jgi:hypothetical protein
MSDVTEVMSSRASGKPLTPSGRWFILSRANNRLLEEYENAKGAVAADGENLSCRGPSEPASSGVILAVAHAVPVPR